MEKITPVKKPSRLSGVLSTLFGLAMLSGACFFLYNELAHDAHFNIKNIALKLRSIPDLNVVISLIMSVLGHVALMGFDFLGVRYVKQPMPFHRIAVASFVSYVLSHNVGSWAGAPFRFRAYHRAGFSTFQITTVVAFCGLTFWLGFLSLGGILLITNTAALSGVFGMSQSALRGLGILFLTLVGLYLSWAWRQKGSVKIFKWYLWPPDPMTAVRQVLVSILDWILAGTTLYFLFPNLQIVPFFSFLGVFVLSQALAFTSQVPGGLGVFEAPFLNFIGPIVGNETVVSAIIAYRAIYYLLPLTIGIFILAIYEWRRRKSRV